MITVDPGAAFERFLRAMHGLAAAGRTNAVGVPTDPRLLAIVLRHADLSLPRIPAALQSGLTAALAGLGRLTGADRTLRPYWPT